MNTIVEQTGLRVEIRHGLNKSVPTGGLSRLIRGVRADLGDPTTAESDIAVEGPSSARVRMSVTPDLLVSVLDGRPCKTPRRHLTDLGLDPMRDLQRHGLPSDDPTAAPDDAAQRAALAEQAGLGRPGGRTHDGGDADTRGRRAA